MALSILYLGSLENSVERGTAGHRADSLRELGHQPDCVEIGTPLHWLGFTIHWFFGRLGWPPDLFRGNAWARKRLTQKRYDILWVDRGRWIRPSTLRFARRVQPHIRLVSYSTDDMTIRGNSSPQFRGALRHYDIHFTTKTHNLEPLRDIGAKNVQWIGSSFEPAVHRPLELSDSELERFGCDVGFVGAFEQERYETLRALARRGISILVRGFDWPEQSDDPHLELRNDRPEGLDYAKAINAANINLGFLRKVARDQHTTRSVEIPACRAFLLAERTGEHLDLFVEGVEAEFFDDVDEAARKIQHYLRDQKALRAVADAGYRRCVDGGYSNLDRLSWALDRVQEIEI